jgi:hypothetical protein
MILALDFDRTLFDTDRDVEAITAAQSLHLIGDPKVNTLVDPAPFLFSDVMPFLQSHEKSNMYIVSAVTVRYGPRSAEYQRDKIEKSGVASYVAHVILTGDSKVEALADIARTHAGMTVAFLDDRTDVLNEIAAALPSVIVVRMSRDGAKVMSDAPLQIGIPTVHSLEEFARVIEQLQRT